MTTETPETRLTPEEESKDAFFRQIADISQAMVAEHGKDFATGAFVLAARWTAEGQMKKPMKPPH